ncbi:MAG: DUF4438 domain-containing protein [Candidatus Saccharicenans sp.]|nr:DUF4438 domain-containing protein [Candidatus Saccharicenans sp.]MDH7494269.1 DUF4438 domain-containing protein [Candidatus Saccharicenans sp.]
MLEPKGKKAGQGLFFLLFFLCLIFILTTTELLAVDTETIQTNKDRLVVMAVKGQVAHPQPSRYYLTTWDGRPKMAIGVAGINYTLSLGDPVFGWAAADQVTVGIATEGVGEDRFRQAWLTHTAVGNEVRVLGGMARGAKGVVIGKFGGYVLVNFDGDTREKLAYGDELQVKAEGIGLAIEGFPEVFVHSLSPAVLEKMGLGLKDGKLEVPLVKKIPAEIVGGGPGAGSLFGHFSIQTCFPPDIKKYGLDELRFGDLVFLEDIQCDYGKGYYKGAGTVGVVVSGPSEISGLGIGVTPVLSCRTGKLTHRLDTEANIAKYLGLPVSSSRTKKWAIKTYNPQLQSQSQKKSNYQGPIRTNKDELLTIAVEGVIQPASALDYSPGYDGKSKLGIGMSSINYSVSYGDTTYGWAEGDHVEPDVTIQGRDRQSPMETALALLACIGNEAVVVSGEASGSKGIYIGRHAGSDDKVWFPAEVKEKLAINDRVLVKARGVGLKILGFENVRVNKISPEALEKIGIVVEGNQLVVPVAAEVPGYLMGSGIGGQGIEAIDYDIQTTCPEAVEKFNLKKLRLGDIVAIRDHYDYYGRGRYEGAVTIGVVIHGSSDYSGHGPGVNPILSSMPGRIKVKLDPMANMAHILGLR